MLTTKTTTTTNAARIASEIHRLEAVEVHVATNDGTYGALEAGRCCGSGDPRFATRDMYETVGGGTRQTGPDYADMPGRLRWIGQEELRDLRKQVGELRRSLRGAR